MVTKVQAEQRRRREPSNAGRSRWVARRHLVPVVAFAARKGPAGSRWWVVQGESHSISQVRLAGGGSMSQWGKAQPPGSEPARSLPRAEQLLCAGQLGRALPFNPQKLHRRDVALLTAPHGGRERRLREVRLPNQ